MLKDVANGEKLIPRHRAAVSWVRHQGRSQVAVLGLLCAALIGCSEEGTHAASDNSPAPQGTPVGDSSVPSLYVDREIEHLSAGVNTLREGYLHRAATCEAAGVPTSPLSKDETARIGTERWQLWRTASQLAYRVESWTVKDGDVRQGNHCHFELVLDGYHAYFDAETTIRRDLATGEKKEGPPEPKRLEIVDTTPDERDLAPWSNWAGPTAQSVAGQPCAQWHSPRGDTSCYWSGGTQWGFSYAPQGIFASNAGFTTGAMVLRAEPAPGVTGDRLTTTKFSIGNAIDPIDMRP